MRSDMNKVICERPRVGHGSDNEKFGGRLSKDEIAACWDDDVDPGPSGFIPWSRRRNKDSKDFTDNLEPLRRYLRKQVGRPWDAVYRDLSAVLDRRTMTGRHVWTHINSEVAQDCYVANNGGIYQIARGVGAALVLRELYVHPLTRLLCYMPPNQQAHLARYAWLRRRETSGPKPITLDDTHTLEQIYGLWYEVTVAKVTVREPGYWHEWVYRGKAQPNHRGWVEARDVVMTTRTKRQLGHKELRRHGLTNAPVSKKAIDRLKRMSA